MRIRNPAKPILTIKAPTLGMCSKEPLIESLKGPHSPKYGIRCTAPCSLTDPTSRPRFSLTLSLGPVFVQNLATASGSHWPHAESNSNSWESGSKIYGR